VLTLGALHPLRAFTKKVSVVKGNIHAAVAAQRRMKIIQVKRYG